ncbi:mitochondrial intermembrane space translocase subunit [Zalerion maritima]|uniref:Mitochondrial import inner membrane translocase subunit n=1 Tax=Zalerion maritima TaxID=339359 RepID=A0AAD5WMJ9_9PEZI|nr:mitochondrial intermembrane space translocase subunit [Zalerion maritima]
MLTEWCWVRRFPGLTNQEQRELQSRMEKRQMKDFMGFFSNLVDNCFESCIDDFSSKALSRRESGCVQRCFSKSLAVQQRLSDRFQEQNQLMMQAQQGK